MSNIHDGIVDDTKVYSTVALARIFGVKQPRSIEEWCKQLGCPVKSLGRTRVVSGHEFRLAVERYVDEGGADLCDEQET
jgi:hypothetical protein